MKKVKRTIPLYKTKSFKSFLSSFISIILGLLFGLIIMIVTNPSNAFLKFPMLIGGWMFGADAGKEIGRWLELLPPLLMCGLGVGLSFKAGLFNIGASGQYTLGLFFALLIGILGKPLGPFQWLVAVLLGMLGGALWGFIPGFFKAVFNINEVITSIMFNYIGMYMVNAIIMSSSSLYNGSRGRTFTINKNAMTPTLGFEKIFPRSNVDLTLLLAIAIAILMWVILNKTTFGFELKAAGSNREAAKYSGINEKKSIILTMVISGALCGLGGAFFILKADSTGTGVEYVPVNVIAGEGFNGIVAALLGSSHPIGTIFSSLFITFLQRGGFHVQPQFKEQLANIVIAVIIYFSAFSMLIGQRFNEFVRKIKHKKNTPVNSEELNAPPIEGVVPDDAPISNNIEGGK